MTAAAAPRARERDHAKASWQLAEGDELVPGRRVLRLLGGGRRYEAYLAWDEHLHALVVAKLLRPHQLGDAAARQALATEAALLRELAHPLLLRSFATVLDGPRPHLVLEHIEGPRLSTLIRRDGLAIEQLLPLGLEVVRLLRYLAAERVVHLDIKPSNIIMAGRPRLIDLSVARRLRDSGALTAPVGTDPYMAPERAGPPVSASWRRRPTCGASAPPCSRRLPACRRSRSTATAFRSCGPRPHRCRARCPLRWPRWSRVASRHARRTGRRSRGSMRSCRRSWSGYPRRG